MHAQALATGEYPGCHSLSPVWFETSVDDHQAEDLHNDRHVPLNLALDLVLGIPQNVMRGLRLKGSSFGGRCL